LRRATPADADTLTAIALEAKAHWGYPAEWLAVWRSALTIHAEWLRSNVAVVAAHQVRPVGFVGMEPVDGGIWILEHLWVLPEWIGQGTGRALLHRAQELARAGGAAALELDADPYAEPFYLRMGARRIGEVAAPVLGIDRWLPRLRFEIG